MSGSVWHYKKLGKLPIWNYRQVEVTDDKRFLLVLNNYDDLPKIGPKTANELDEAWEKMDLEGLAAMDRTDDFNDNLRDRKEILILDLQDLGEEDSDIQNLLGTLRVEFRVRWGVDEEVKTLTLEQECAVIEEGLGLGFQIDVYTVSVTRFRAYVTSLKRKVKSANDAQNLKNKKNG